MEPPSLGQKEDADGKDLRSVPRCWSRSSTRSNRSERPSDAETRNRCLAEGAAANVNEVVARINAVVG